MAQCGWGYYIKQRGRCRVERQQRLELNRERIKQIKSHAKSRIIRYPEYSEAFDYVHNLYPFAHVRSATVYQVPRSVSEEIGYRGAGGFFDTQSKIIVVTDCVEIDEQIPMKIRANLSPDEVLCHELIHYAANYKNPVSSRAVEEEIAYGKSINYLRAKGRTDDDIIDNVMMPYLVSCVGVVGLLYKIASLHEIPIKEIVEMSESGITKHFGTELNALCKEEARKIGLAIVGYQSPQIPQLSKSQTQSRSFVLNDDI